MKFAALEAEGAQIMATGTRDWSQCPAVESVPGKRCSAWVFRDTRTPVSVVFDNLEVGASIGEIMEWFHLSYEQVVAVSRVGRHHLPDHKPVEQHSDTGQMLLDRGNSALVLQQLDICGHMHRLNAPEFAKPLPFRTSAQTPRQPAHMPPACFCYEC